MENLSHCPECNSTSIKFFDARKSYNCIDCGCSFSNQDHEAKKLRIFLSYDHDDNEELVRLNKAKDKINKAINSIGLFKYFMNINH